MMINIIATTGRRGRGVGRIERRRNSPANNIDSVEIEIIFRRLRFEESNPTQKREKALKIYLFLSRRWFSSSIPTEKGKLKDCVTRSQCRFVQCAVMKLNFSGNAVGNEFLLLYSAIACQRDVKHLFMDGNLKFTVKLKGGWAKVHFVGATFLGFLKFNFKEFYKFNCCIITPFIYYF